MSASRSSSEELELKRRTAKSRSGKRSDVYYLERRRRVAELRVLGNLTWEKIGQQIATYGFKPMTADRAWRDYQAFVKDSASRLDSLERKGEIVSKLDGLFALTLMAYRDAERQSPDGTKKVDSISRAMLIQRALEIVDRLGSIAGLLGQKHEHAGEFRVTIDDIVRAENALAEERRKGIRPKALV